MLVSTWVSCLLLLVLVNDLILIGQFHILVLHVVALTTNISSVSFTDTTLVYMNTNASWGKNAA